MMERAYGTPAEQAALLASCAVRGEAPPGELVSRMDLGRVYEAAARHSLASAAGTALEAAGIRDERFHRAIAQAQRRILLLDRDRARVLAALEDAGIWYMPLKGAVMKERYPGFGLREMADNDILFDAARAKDVRRIMLELGFTQEHYGADAHDVYMRPPVSNFEMHRKLFSETVFSGIRGSGVAAYYEHVKDRLIKDEGNGFGYHFSDEDFYLYMTAHEYKHYSENGTGLRSLLDIYVFLRSCRPDMAYIAREAQKMGIADFERTNRELAEALFSGRELTAAQREMFGRIADAGAYGEMEEGIRKKVAQRGRLRYFLARLVPPYSYMTEAFPSLRRAPFLYPAYCAARLARGVFSRRRGKAAAEMKAVLGLLPERGKQDPPAR